MFHKTKLQQYLEWALKLMSKLKDKFHIRKQRICYNQSNLDLLLCLTTDFESSSYVISHTSAFSPCFPSLSLLSCQPAFHWDHSWCFFSETSTEEPDASLRSCVRALLVSVLSLTFFIHSTKEIGTNYVFMQQTASKQASAWVKIKISFFKKGLQQPWRICAPKCFKKLHNSGSL